ncbi:MAG: hypothetical protein JNK85_17525 [Verrucomicrobiales bacterium]|nr:hypothetical protein [Verrucomicrobiales bacterium]
MGPDSARPSPITAARDYDSRQSRGARSLVLIIAAIVTTALWLPADGRFPVRDLEPPPRRLSTLARLETPRLAAVHRDRQALAEGRRSLPPIPGLTDFRVICHAHAEDSVHTGGTRPEMLMGAREAGVNAIFLTDHFRPPRDFMDSWRGLHEGVLFVPGSEARGFLIHPQTSVMDGMNGSVPELLSKVRDQGGLAFLSHIEERPDHPMDQLDGLEIYNRHWDAKRDRVTLIALALKLTNPRDIAQLDDALRRFPDEVLGAQVDYPSDYLAKWDAETPRRRLTGVAANDAHHNQVFIVKMVDETTVLLGTIVDPDDKKQRVSALLRPGIRELTRGRQPGDVLVRLDFDPYARAFRCVATHVLAPELTEASLRDALRAGRAYVAHDWMADPTGFRFEIGERSRRGDPTLGIFGSEIEYREGLELRAEFPVRCSRIRLLRNGAPIAVGRGESFTHRLTTPGVYRIEGWLMLDGEERCWLFGNPIYLR